MLKAAKAIVILCGFALLSIALHVGTARAQQLPCAPFAKVRAGLAKDYNEVIVSGGLVSDQKMMLVFASPGCETWTIILVDPADRACFLASGQHWFQDDMPAAGGKM